MKTLLIYVLIFSDLLLAISSYNPLASNPNMTINVFSKSLIETANLIFAEYSKKDHTLRDLPQNYILFRHKSNTETKINFTIKNICLGEAISIACAKFGKSLQISKDGWHLVIIDSGLKGSYFMQLLPELKQLLDYSPMNTTPKAADKDKIEELKKYNTILSSVSLGKKRLGIYEVRCSPDNLLKLISYQNLISSGWINSPPKEGDYPALLGE